MSEPQPEDSNQNNNSQQPEESYETQNGHLSPTNGLKNGEGVVDPGLAVAQTTSPSFAAQPPVQEQVAGEELVSPNTSHHPPSAHHNQPVNGGQSRSESPTSTNHGSAATGQQHVVHVHVIAGETFSVRVGTQQQHIEGPATVRMVSNSGPPLPMPMQVPPGHMVQQIVDEHGILTHVILSPQPQAMPGTPMTAGTPMTGGPSNAAQYYNPYGQHYPAPQYAPHHHAHHGGPPHMHHPGVTHPHMHGTPPPHSCNNHASGPSPPVSTMDERSTRQRARTRSKYARRVEDGYYSSRGPQPPRRRNGAKVNGDIPQINNVSRMSPTENGPELEEERRIIQQQLSNMPEPKISDIEARKALIQLSPPEYDQSEFEIDLSDFQYELLLSRKEGKYELVYSGDATEITLEDLKPATEYFLRVCTLLDDVKGNQTEPVSFKTKACEPDHPPLPKLSSKNKTSITLKWNVAIDNGEKITSYVLECDQGHGETSFVDVYNGPQRQHRVSKLQASTKYAFRIAAINSIGKSRYNDPVSFYTSGTAPSQPDPPMLSEKFVSAVTISWIKRQNDDEFLLQMEDEATGHGFMPVYNGPNLSYTIKNLRRNTEYRFRLSSKNDEGQSRWSDAVCYQTLPDRPGPPGKTQIKGKVHAHNFRVIWDPPKDNGGSEITKYIVDLDDGRAFETVYEGTERDHVCDHLIPGHQYRVRVSCCSAGGRSEWSDCCFTTTEAVPPGQCQSPKLQGKPKATSLHLRWTYPDYDGGSQVTEFSAQMITPDNLTQEVYKGRDLDCIVAGLSPGRAYLFEVRAFNRAGKGPWSGPLEVVSGAGVPDPPKNPTVSCRSPHSAIVSWEEPVNNGATVTDYKLEWQQRVQSDFTQLYFGPNVMYEVKALIPAATYSFRVQAMNSAGPGAFSLSSTCITPPSSPAAVLTIRYISTATTATLFWKDPNDNGSDIVAYNISIGEKQVLTVDSVPEYTIQSLHPETTYKIRIQAVNGIGVGAFSAPTKVTTRALPPNPPRLECAAAAPNNLKLKWGDGRNADLTMYALEMDKDDDNFQSVYAGPAHSFKVNKLSELLNYDFRICASNEAGEGAYSDIYTFSTTKAPPPALKAPRPYDVTLTSCTVEWSGCKAMGGDPIIYLLQMLCVGNREHEYREIYRGPESCFCIQNLQPKMDYQLRVCAIRQCDGGVGDITGAFSPGTLLTMLSPEPVKTSLLKNSEARLVEVKQLTDEHYAMIILGVFVVLALLVAFVAQQIIAAYTTGPSGGKLS